jgi:hypothetical protein
LNGQQYSDWGYVPGPLGGHTTMPAFPRRPCHPCRCPVSVMAVVMDAKSGLARTRFGFLTGPDLARGKQARCAGSAMGGKVTESDG